MVTFFKVHLRVLAALGNGAPSEVARVELRASAPAVGRLDQNLTQILKKRTSTRPRER
jgi:hypothetical protein